MKSNLNKFFFNLSSIFFLCSCHTLEHQNIFVHGIKKSQDQKIITTENERTKNKKVDKKKISNKEEMAPIKVPKKVQKVKTVALNKRINLPKMEKFTLSVFKGWSEDKQLRKRAIELNNGRAAQMGILALMVHEKLDNNPYVINSLLGSPVPFNA